MKYLSNGLSSKNPNIPDCFYVNDISGELTFEGADIFYDIDAKCVSLYDKFTNQIFPDIDSYYRQLSVIPQWITDAGIDSDSGIDDKSFTKFLKDIQNKDLNKHLFLSDCHTLIGNVQNRIISSKSLFSLFYKSLCEVQPHFFEKDGIYWTAGENVIMVFSILHDLFATNYAIMDLITKVAYQLENIPADFFEWPSLSCSKIVYGDKGKISKIDIPGTIFEEDYIIKIIISLRHELIHNGTWESQQKIFYRISAGKVTEKFIYQPDIRDSGTLIKVKNRKRFFAQEKKINQTLPELCIKFWEKVLLTLAHLEECKY